MFFLSLSDRPFILYAIFFLLELYFLLYHFWTFKILYIFKVPFFCFKDQRALVKLLKARFSPAYFDYLKKTCYLVLSCEDARNEGQVQIQPLLICFNDIEQHKTFAITTQNGSLEFIHSTDDKFTSTACN